MNTDEGPAFSPAPNYPQHAEFYRRVLEYWPSPVLVVNNVGEIVYGNNALSLLGGWDTHGLVGSNIVDFIHPDDAASLVEVFVELVGSDEAKQFEATPWAPVQTRLVAANGQAIPVTVTGTGGLDDGAVNGIIYDIRPGHEQDILRRGLTGLAEGEPIDTILGLITDMIALPPLDLDAAILEPRGDGSYRIIGATDDALGSLLAQARDPAPWNSPARQPQRTIVSQFPGDTGEDLFAAGYRDFWHVAPEHGSHLNTYRIVATGPTIHRPAAGPIDRLARANELASVVLLRARADAMLEHSATHDRLTSLPNREGFHRRATERLERSTAETAAMLFIDLDGFKPVNDAYGHAAGDRVLEVIAERLKTVTRAVDLVARIGGDEFVVLVGASADRPANRGRVQVIADRALHQIARDVELGDASARVTASIGAYIAPMPVGLDELLAHADAAMYEAKRAGGNRRYIADA